MDTIGATIRDRQNLKFVISNWVSSLIPVLFIDGLIFPRKKTLTELKEEGV